MEHPCPGCGRILTPFFNGDEAIWRCPECGYSRDVDSADLPAQLLECIEHGDSQAWEWAVRVLSVPAEPEVLDAFVAELVRGRPSLLSDEKQGALPAIAVAAAAVLVFTLVFVFALPAVEALGDRIISLCYLLIPPLVIALFVLMRRGLFTLDWLGGREGRIAAAVTRVIESTDDPRSVGWLAQLYLVRRFSEVAEGKLSALLPSFQDQHVAAIGAAGLKALTDLLNPGVLPKKDGQVQWDLAVGAANALSLTGHQPAVPALKKMAYDNVWSWPVPGDVCRAAQTALYRLQQRLSTARERKSLLRASSPLEVDTDTLLRRAGEGEEPERQLLRKADDPEDRNQ